MQNYPFYRKRPTFYFLLFLLSKKGCPLAPLMRISINYKRKRLDVFSHQIKH